MKDETMSMNEGGASNQNAGTTVEGASGWFTEQTMMDMATEPALQDMMFALQDGACTTLSALIDKTATLLMQDAERSLETHSPLAAQQPARLKKTSKRRRKAWQKARELAQMLVIGALTNKDNPAWDPVDFSSCAKEEEGARPSLIRFELEDGGAYSSPAD